MAERFVLVGCGLRGAGLRGLEIRGLRDRPHLLRRRRFAIDCGLGSKARSHRALAVSSSSKMLARGLDIRLPLLVASAAPSGGIGFEYFDDLSCERPRVEPRGRKICHLAGIKTRKRSAESKEGAVGLALMNLSAKHRNLVLREFRLDALQRPGPDGCARARKEDGKRNFALKGLLLALHQLDGLDGLGGVKMRTLGGNDDEIRAAHGIARHHRGRSFQIDNDEGRLQCRRFDRVDDGFFGRRYR